MKKILCISLILILAMAVLAGCSGKTANPAPLTPIYANGVSPDYSGSQDTPDDSDDTSSATDTDKAEDPDDTQAPEISAIPEGFVEYKDSFVSFIHPENVKKAIDFYLFDSTYGSDITIYAEDVDSTSANFELNVYNDVTTENFAESYAFAIGAIEDIADLKITKSKTDGYEITVIQYYDAVEEVEEPEETTEGTTEVPATPRYGTAHVYVENSSDESFGEILIAIGACEYVSEATPEGYTNFSQIVANLVESLEIVAE